MAIIDKNQRWGPSGQMKSLDQALTSQGKGSGSLMSSALKARVAEWREAGGRGQRERRKGRRRKPLWRLQPLSRLGGPVSQLGALGRLRGLPHVCPLLHGALQGLGLLLVHLHVIHLLVRGDGRRGWLRDEQGSTRGCEFSRAGGQGWAPPELFQGRGGRPPPATDWP